MSNALSVNGVSLNYLVQGSGPPLYLLHGGMESRESFKEQIPHFAKRFTVVALDSRGQGRSSASQEPFSYELLANDVLALADHLGHEQVSIMGSSDGAITAMTIALNHPGRISRLVLLGASFHFEGYPPEMIEFLSTYEWDGHTDRDRYPGMMIKHYLTGHDTLEGFGERLKEMSVMWTTSPTHTVEEVAKITAETLVVNGDHEDTPLEHVLQLYQALPNAELFVVPGGTHYSLETHAELINQVSLAFLSD